MKYLIKIDETLYSDIEIEIEAENKDEACEIALNGDYDHDMAITEPYDSKIRIVDIKETTK